MNKIKIKEAKGILAGFLRVMGFKGWASLWDTVYVLPGNKNNAPLIQHELIHLEQMNREGKFLFVLKYIWWLLIKGYTNNPYEVEARSSFK